jgi:soluble lytic murein transglycosylase-like protein
MLKERQNIPQGVMEMCFKLFFLLLIMPLMIGIGEYRTSTLLSDSNKVDVMICSASQAIHPPHGADESKGEILFSRSLKEKETAFEPIILQAAKRYDIDAAMIKAIIMAESNFNPKAVSNKGAKGLMQLMPGTAEYLGVEDSFDPTHNIEGGVRYFKILLDRFQDDIKLALAAYNAGSRNVRKYGGVPPFRTTQSYIDKVLKYYADFNAV